MNDDKNPGCGRKVETILTWAAMLYLLAWLFDWLAGRKWGAFLILTLLGTTGWAVPLCYIFYYTTDVDYSRIVLAISMPLGAITAICYMAKDGIFGRPNKRRRR